MRLLAVFVGVAGLTGLTCSGCIFGCDSGDVSPPHEQFPTTTRAARIPAPCASEPTFAGGGRVTVDLLGAASPSELTLDVQENPAIGVATPIRVDDPQGASGVQSASAADDSLRLVYTPGTPGADGSALAIAAVVVTVQASPRTDQVAADLEVRFADGRVFHQIVGDELESAIDCAAR